MAIVVWVVVISAVSGIVALSREKTTTNLGRVARKILEANVLFLLCAFLYGKAENRHLNSYYDFDPVFNQQWSEDRQKDNEIKLQMSKSVVDAGNFQYDIDEMRKPWRKRGSLVLYLLVLPALYYGFGRGITGVWIETGSWSLGDREAIDTVMLKRRFTAITSTGCLLGMLGILGLIASVIAFVVGLILRWMEASQGAIDKCDSITLGILSTAMLGATAGVVASSLREEFGKMKQEEVQSQMLLEFEGGFRMAAALAVVFAIPAAKVVLWLMQYIQGRVGGISPWAKEEEVLSAIDTFGRMSDSPFCWLIFCGFIFLVFVMGGLDSIKERLKLADALASLPETSEREEKRA